MTESELGPLHLLFVCTGNTCRSPMASGLARRMLEDRGWDAVEVRSAGVAASPGSPASKGALRASEAHGIDLSSHRSAQLTEDLVRWADLVLTMSEGHLASVEYLGGSGKAALITDFGGADGGPERTPSDGVRDPIGGDDYAYAQTFEELRVLIDRSLERLASTQSK